VEASSLQFQRIFHEWPDISSPALTTLRQDIVIRVLNCRSAAKHIASPNTFGHSKSTNYWLQSLHLKHFRLRSANLDFKQAQTYVNGLSFFFDSFSFSVSIKDPLTTTFNGNPKTTPPHPFDEDFNSFVNIILQSLTLCPFPCLSRRES
jgi:hypothetical protein